MTGARADVVVRASTPATRARARACAAGKLPTFGRLLGGWARARIRNPFGLFVGAIWPAFSTACSPARTDFYCWESVSPTTYERGPATDGHAGARPSGGRSA